MDAFVHSRRSPRTYAQNRARLPSCYSLRRRLVNRKSNSIYFSPPHRTINFKTNSDYTTIIKTVLVQSVQSKQNHDIGSISAIELKPHRAPCSQHVQGHRKPSPYQENCIRNNAVLISGEHIKKNCNDQSRQLHADGVLGNDRCATQRARSNLVSDQLSSTSPASSGFRGWS